MCYCIAKSPIDSKDPNSLFVMIDGHGGPEVAIWLRDNFLETLVKSPAYQAKQWERAITDVLPMLDRKLNAVNG